MKPVTKILIGAAMAGLVLIGAGIAVLFAIVSAIGGEAARQDQAESGQCRTGGDEDSDDEDGGGEDSDDGDGGSVDIPDEYEEDIAAAAEESGLPEGLLAAQIHHESRWDPDAESEANARGIAQFLDETWDEWGDGGDVSDPHDSIAAQGRYMGYFVDAFEDHAEDDEHLMELAIAGYHAGEGNVQRADYEVEDVGPRTHQYVQNIMADADGGTMVSRCEPGEFSGEMAEISAELAWDEEVSLSTSTSADHGKDDSKDEYVDAVEILDQQPTHAYYTDCGVFTATVVHQAGVDPDFPVRGTSAQYDYFRESDQWEFFEPDSEGDLEAGDILIVTSGGVESVGHTYMYTGERHSGEDGRAQGASLTVRPPSGHSFYLDDSRGAYMAARPVDSEGADEESSDDDSLDTDDMGD